MVRRSAGSGKSNIYLVAPKYQIVANGVYQGPWGLNFGGNLVTRQGYAEPFFRSNVVTGDPLGRKTVLLVDDVDDFRLPAVTSLDARIEKKFTFGKARSRARLRRVQRAELGHRARQAVRRAPDRPDRVRAGPRDHEPAHRAAGRAVLLQ